MIGRTLGAYQVVAKLGEGGMGEVYRARDVRLNRDVAIKVLPGAFVNDRDRRDRFQRETQAIAALSHPNILAIYDVNLDGETAYAVTELLDGETLRDRLTTGALSVRKTVEYAVQIARGLAAAHDRGVIHRDLKPENIFLCHDGQVKILDFGLARAADAGTGSTQTALTDPGTVLGTVGYMAPEQVRGQLTDARSDLFAFGAVLYEMLSGKRAFSGDTAADTISAILKEEPPDLTASRPDVSPSLDRIVRHCLEKSPGERFQSARDVAFALEALSGSGSGSSLALPAVPVVKRRGTLIALGALALLAAAAAGALVHAVWKPAANEVSFDVKTFDRQMVMNARFMPDGQTIVFSAARQGTVPELYMLHPGSAAPQLVAGSGTHLLAVSSTGELAVLTNSQYINHRLFKGTLARLTPGGSPRQWLEHVREADWSPDGSTLAIIRDGENGIDRLEYPVGTVLHELHGYLSDVRVSHDGRRVAFVEHHYRYDDRGAVKVIDTDKRALASTSDYWGVEGLAWTADDSRVVFAASDWRGSNGIGYRPLALRIRGSQPPTHVLATMSDTMVLDVAPDGRWLMTSESRTFSFVVKKPGATEERDLSWLDRSFANALSRDGEVAVFTSENVNEGSTYAVMIRKTDGAPPTRLGDGAAEQFGLSPDGNWVAAQNLATNKYVFYPTGAGDPRHLDIAANQFQFNGWFPDSAHVMLCGGPSASALRCYRQATAGGPMTPLGPATGVGGAVMSDGTAVVVDANQVAWRYPPNGGPSRIPDRMSDGTFVGFAADNEPFFARNQDGKQEIYYAPFGGPAQKLAEIKLGDRAGLNRFSVTQVVGDAKRFGYIYAYARGLSTLLVATGIRVK